MSNQPTEMSVSPETRTMAARQLADRYLADDAEQLGDVLKFHWEALDKDGEPFAVGLHVLVLAADGRIERDYTFVGA